MNFRMQSIAHRARAPSLMTTALQFAGGSKGSYYFNMTTDLRPLLFEGATWYRQLTCPEHDDEPSAWYLAKGDSSGWGGDVLSAGAQFAIDHDLLDVYRKRFAGINANDLLPARAKAERRTVSSPIWIIANELIVGRYLEKVLKWIFECHEPLGNKAHCGEWQFRMLDGKSVFVEVKTALEPAAPTSCVYSRGVQDAHVRDILKGAYKQLPDDDRATLVVVAGHEIANPSLGIMHGDLFQTLFGKYQLTFRPFADDPNYHAGPSFRDTHVNGTKHRRLGCVAGLFLSGSRETPHVGFYAIDNPYAAPTKRIANSNLLPAHRFMIDNGGHGEEQPGKSDEDIWQAMAPAVQGQNGVVSHK